MTIGASGAIYGVLLAYALYFPHRPIYLYFVFPIPAQYFVMIVGAITFLSSIGGGGGGVAHTAHLGGLVVGYLYLKGLRGRPLDELKYRWLRWKMNRARGKFDVYSGGRRGDDDGWKRTGRSTSTRDVRPSGVSADPGDGQADLGAGRWSPDPRTVPRA